MFLYITTIKKLCVHFIVFTKPSSPEHMPPPQNYKAVLTLSTGLDNYPLSCVATGLTINNISNRFSHVQHFQCILRYSKIPLI